MPIYVKKYQFLTLLWTALLWNGIPLSAQQYYSCAINQWIEVKAYQNKAFRFTAAIKCNKGWISPRAIFNNQKDDFHSRYRSRVWETALIEGQILPDADSLNLQVFAYFIGEAFYDDFRLEVETNPGNWEAIPLINGNFESWTDNGKLIGWEGQAYLFENFKVEVSSKEAYEGNYALKIYSLDKPIDQEHQISGTKSGKTFDVFDAEEKNIGGLVLQDQYGFIWMDRPDGLVRYDGIEYKLYGHDPGDSLSLSSHDIFCLYEDRSGNLWIGTWSTGLNFFDRKAETFHRFQHDPEDPQICSSQQ